DQLELARLVAVPRGEVLELLDRDRRKENLVADAAALEDHAVLELLPDPSAERRDHASRPPRRERPVSARASASATCEGVGSRASPRSRPTERCTCSLEAAPLAVTARLTSAGLSASTLTSCWRAARQTTPRACAMSSAVRGNQYSVYRSSRTSTDGAWLARSRCTPS